MNFINPFKIDLFLTLNRDDLTKGLQYFNGDTPPDGGEPPADTPPDDKQPPEKTFTQEELNALIAKEKKTTQENFLKSVGITDFKNAKDAIAKFNEWQESQKTEAQKQAEALEAATKKLEAEKADKENLSAKLAAVTAGANADSLDDVILLAQPKVSEEVTIEQAIEQVLEKYPHFKGTAQQQEDKPPAPQFTPGNPNPPQGGKDDPFTAKLAKYQ